MLANHPGNESFISDKEWQQEIAKLFKGSIVTYSNSRVISKSKFTAGEYPTDPYINLSQAICHYKLVVYAIDIRNTKLMEYLK